MNSSWNLGAVFLSVATSMAIASPSYAQVGQRQLEVRSTYSTQVVLIPQGEIDTLKDKREDSYSGVSFSFFIREYAIRIRRFPTENLTRSNNNSRYMGRLPHNSTLHYIVYRSCGQNFSTEFRDFLEPEEQPARGAVRTWTIGDTCDRR